MPDKTMETTENADTTMTESTTTESPPIGNDGTSIVPQLQEHGITFDELQTAVKVLQAVSAWNRPKRKRANDGSDPSLDSEDHPYKHSNMRPFRKALASCLDIHQRFLYEGKPAWEHFQEKMQERTLKRQRNAETAQQRKYIADTALRRGRIEKLQQKQAEGQDEEQAKLASQHSKLMIPDGPVHALPMSTTNTTNNDAEKESVTVETVEEETTEQEPVRLPKLRSCYVCKARFRELHSFYDQLCPSCAVLNFEKRHQTADMKGKVAVVTGSRVKIGYHTCLKLLRAGATVVATTRFPNSAADTYRKEADFAEWKDRLFVYGLDLRDVTGIEAFCRFLKGQFADSGVDVLINNACQTIRRPAAYYLPACEKETKLWKEADDTHKKLLSGCRAFEAVRRRLVVDQSGQAQPGNRIAATGTTPMPAITSGEEAETSGNASSEDVSTMVVAEKAADNTRVPFEETGISHSAAMSQMIILPEDAGVPDSVLPPGVTDINGQQLDLRKTNSWLLKMEEVSTPEVMECMFVNAIAPFVLNSRLKPLMSIPNDHSGRYIINVSAMEGKFYRYKMPNHPHTNMAKAALNMMTRTSAEDLAKNHRIFMNSVDTGWINDENPLERASNTAQNNHFQTPIDEVDAAARILDPIFDDLNNPDREDKVFGKFLKDYRETEW